VISISCSRAGAGECHEKISFRYPLVELITAVLSLLLFWKFGLTFQYLFSFIFVCALMVITFIDLTIRSFLMSSPARYPDFFSGSGLRHESSLPGCLSRVSHRRRMPLWDWLLFTNWSPKEKGWAEGISTAGHDWSFFWAGNPCFLFSS